MLLSCLCTASPGLAGEDEIRFDGISDFGGVGLMQTPTARFGPEGQFSISSSRVAPYFRNALTMQALPWFEGVWRYTTEQHVQWGHQANKDKGFDVKVRLIEESADTPAIAIGLRDFGGTGLFSSEYLVMSRRYYDFDFNLGIGWGNLGARGQIPNPLTWLSGRFNTRNNAAGLGGTLSPSYFHGERASLFGGIAYRTAIPGLTLKLELDGNDYGSEAHPIKQRASSPFNVGLGYKYDDWLELSLGMERGNTLLAKLVLSGNLHSVVGMPKFDPPPDKVTPRSSVETITMPPRAKEPRDVDPVLQIARSLEAHGYKVKGVAIRGQRATVMASQDTFRAPPKGIGRATRLIANAAPPEVEELSYVVMESGMPASRITILRKDLEQAADSQGSPEEIGVHVRIEPADLDIEESLGNEGSSYPDVSWRWSPGIRHHIGGPDNPYLYQVLMGLSGEFQWSSKLSLTGSLALNIHNNLDQLKVPSDSVLPHVRSDIKEYLKEGKNGIERLEMDYLTQLGTNWYGRVSAGLLEEMFGGISTELLYRPFSKRWAIGADINQVRQRGFTKRFDFRDYSVTTGHFDLYYQLPFYNTQLQFTGGRYLAGDLGFTVDVSRRFDTGAVLGAFFTRTNVSAEQFGEGSFDKGFYISIPVDLLSFYSVRNTFGMGYRPLTRDGGQRLNVGKRLYPLLRDSGPDALMRDWNQFLD